MHALDLVVLVVTAPNRLPVTTANSEQEGVLSRLGARDRTRAVLKAPDLGVI
ncbi:hypothetical protein [Deinococcus peraridilitoris]|uniref:hypothetical protein n=1 Tax=Deinococcus peraridilitoris TaxID=432329 RepID=UPI0003036476|nr:hypothetical protein [Deinococcus peraridilitoris]